MACINVYQIVFTMMNEATGFLGDHQDDSVGFEKSLGFTVG